MTDADTAARAVEAFAARDTGTPSMGISIRSVAPGEVRAAMTPGPDHLNGYGGVHGGAIYYLALAAFGYAANSLNRQAYGQSGAITYVAPAPAGEELVATGRIIHQSPRNLQVDVEVAATNGHVVAIFRGGAHVTDKPWI